jgi:predicted transcriptional regulator
MTTTSLKLPDELKESIQRIAAQCKTSPHAFMLQTLESEVQRRMQRADFLAEAQASADEIDAGGPVYALDEVHAWVKVKIGSHATGQKVKDPKPMRAPRRIG